MNSVLQTPEFQLCYTNFRPFHVALVVKNPPANAGDVRTMGSIPGLGRCPGEGNGNPFKNSCLENPMDRRARQAPWGNKELDMTEHACKQALSL